MPIIQVEQVTKHYPSQGGPVTALDSISLTLVKGEFAALAGPSGSGKTTLLNLIGGLDAPSVGTITVDHVRLNDLSPNELAKLRLEKIGFVFQAFNLIPVLSALENVEYILLLQGLDSAQRRSKSERVLREVGLKKEMHRRPHELSGGQQQRVAVARAIVSEPAIVLADEPTANLDQNTGAQLLQLMRHLNTSRNITFLFSTHDPMVMEKAQRLIRLKDGRISNDG